MFGYDINFPFSFLESKTPTWGDRFIPNRSATDYDLANYLVKTSLFSIVAILYFDVLFKINQKDEDEENDANSQAQRDRKVMNDNLFGGDVSNRRVMQFGQKAPTSLVN
jgi:hypothetical protein